VLYRVCCLYLDFDLSQVKQSFPSSISDKDESYSKQKGNTTKNKNDKTKKL